MSDSSEKRSSRWAALLAASFIPFFIKAGAYAMLGSYVPLLVFLGFVGLVCWGFYKGPRAGIRTIKIWAATMLVWGVIRLGLMVILHQVDIGEVHPVHQTGTWYVLVSLGHIVLGLYLYRGCRRAFGGDPSAPGT